MSELMKSMSDNHLITSTGKVVSTLRRVDLALLEHLAAIEARELHLKSGYSSLFKMCTEHFRLSESSAYRRVAASRLIQKYPSVKAQFLAGDVNMCTLAAVAARLGELTTEEERQELLGSIKGKSKSQVEELLSLRCAGTAAKRRDVIRPMRAAQMPMAFRHSNRDQPTTPKMEPVNDGLAQLSPTQSNQASAVDVSFRIAFTASATFRSKLQRAAELLKHKHPDGGLESILEEALDHLIKARDLTLKRSKLSHKKTTNARYIPASVKREVLVRDGGQCTFTTTAGHRCQERSGLEFEHRVPFAKGGSSVDVGNIELLCRGHNAWRARQEFSKAREFCARGRST